jgi:hypothetical protein
MEHVKTANFVCDEPPYRNPIVLPELQVNWVCITQIQI